MNTLENILGEVDIERGYQLLTPRERKIISLYYLEGYKDEEIAKIYGVCQQNINRQRIRGMSKLKIF
jgi:RNA polymerase sigma factor (sigma-70 family)